MITLRNKAQVICSAQAVFGDADGMAERAIDWRVGPMEPVSPVIAKLCNGTGGFLVAGQVIAPRAPSSGGGGR